MGMIAVCKRQSFVWSLLELGTRLLAQYSSPEEHGFDFICSLKKISEKQRAFFCFFCFGGVWCIGSS
jgi:hypothetical protein